MSEVSLGLEEETESSSEGEGDLDLFIGELMDQRR